MGDSIATLEYVQIVHTLYPMLEHGLNHQDLLRNDCHNWSSAQHLCNREVVMCLEHLRSRPDEQVEMTMATKIYLSICGDYIDIFLNHQLDLQTIIFYYARVSFFLYWRLWLKFGHHGVRGNNQRLSWDNTISSQSFYDIQMSVHFLCF